MIRNSIFILCSLLALAASAQVPGELCGKIVDAANGEPIAGVILQSKGTFASSDSQGAFRLKLKTGADSVAFRCMGYEPVKLPVTADFSTIRLSPRATVLRDVIVKAPDIYAKGDTLVFNVEQFANASDNAILDVIKRLPGIKVKDDGTIEYQGKPINKFYINGNDFIGGQYGLATENISHKDVKSVEVMENHQPVKALEGIEFPEEAGINLKLKEDAQSRWVGVVEGATGVEPLLYDASLFTMRIAPSVQSMFTLKGDNTGWNPASQITEHDYYEMFGSEYIDNPWMEYISADIITSPLNERRTRDNLSWIANAINAWRSGDASMRLNMNYMGDRLDYKTGVTTDYLSQSIPTFVQMNDMRTQSHMLSAQLNTEINNPGHFLKDKLTVDAEWDKSRSAITGTYDVTQRVARHNLTANNDLKLVKRNDKRLFTLVSRNTFDYQPDKLTVIDADETTQKAGTTDFRSTTETKLGRMTRFWKYYINFGIDLNYHKLSLALTGLDRWDNDEDYNVFISRIYSTPQVDYERGNWRISMKMPVRWDHYSIDGQHDYINVCPNLYVRRQLTAKSDVSASVNHSLMSPSAFMYVDVPVLNDYRNLFMAKSFAGSVNSSSASLSYRYRNPLNALFANVSASYSHMRMPYSSNQLFIDDFIISTYADSKSSADSWNAKVGFGKGIGHGKMVAGAEAVISATNGESMRDNERYAYRQRTLELSPYIKGSICRWMSVNYDLKYRCSQLKVEGDAGKTYHNVVQKGSVLFYPNDNWQFTMGAEHYFTRFPEHNSAALVLLDASAIWKITGKMRLTLTGKNLLNNHQYKYINYGTLSQSEYAFSIRPRNILLSLQVRF